MPDRLIEALSRLKGTKVLVIGDVMLDEHVWSRVNRISPEAPVPVADVTSITYAPGGAGNVANNIRALGGEVCLIGVIGSDKDGEKLREVLIEKGIDTSSLVADAGRPTTLKSRIIAHGQQVVRVDHEEKKPISAPVAGRILELVNSKLQEADAVLISDYAKGLVTPEICQKVIAAARAQGKLVAVDPKGRDYGKYRGATVITPNMREAEEATGIPIANGDKAAEVARKLLGELDLAYVLITRGEEGMSLIGRGGPITHIPAAAVEVYDVTGAGDTAIAAVTLALAAGLDIEPAARLANWAAGAKVRKVGTATVTPEEIEQSIRHGTGAGFHRKIVSLEELKGTVRSLKEKGRKIVFTNGCFDIIHLGHVQYLQQAKEFGDVLIVGINSDDSVRRIKGERRPILPQEEREQIIAALESVDYVVVFSETTPEKLIKILKPDIHVKGGDYQGKSLPEAKTVESYGGRVVVVDEIEGKSTTRIIEAIARAFQHSPDDVEHSGKG